MLEDGTMCVLDCSVVASVKGAGNTSWSLPKTAEGPLLTLLLCKPISCVGPNFSNLLQAITCPFIAILLAALNGLNLTRAVFCF